MMENPRQCISLFKKRIFKDTWKTWCVPWQLLCESWQQNDLPWQLVHQASELFWTDDLDQSRIVYAAIHQEAQTTLNRDEKVSQ
jgi:hypothetical protein